MPLVRKGSQVRQGKQETRRIMKRDSIERENWSGREIPAWKNIRE